MDKINWGIIGTSGFAYDVAIPALSQANNGNLYAIAGRSLEKATMYKEKFGFEKAFSSYDELLKDSEVQAVYIPLANNVHKEWVIKAANMGKHILCEKPIAPNVADYKEMVNAANANKVVLMEAYAYIHAEITNHIKSAIKQGVIGDVAFLEGSFFVKMPDSSNYRCKKEGYGGGIYDLGCYPISLFIYLLDDTPKKVTGFANFTAEGIDDYAATLLEFNGGAKASVTCAMCSTTNASRYFIYGTKGIIEAPIPFNACGDLSYFITDGDGKVTKVDVKTTNNYVLEFEQLGRCVLQAESPFVSNEFSLSTTKAIEDVILAVGY